MNPEKNSSRHSLWSPRAWQFRPAEWRTLLVLGDFFVAVLALGIALYLWATGDHWLGVSIEFLRDRVPFWFYALPLVWLILLLELYDVHRIGDWQATVRGVGTAALLGLGLYLLVFFYFAGSPKSILPRRGVAGFVVAASALMLVWRHLIYQVIKNRQFVRRFLLVGAGRSGQELLEVFENMNPLPFTLVGVIDDNYPNLGKHIGKYPVLGGCNSLLDIVTEQYVTDIVVAISGEMRGQMFQVLLDAQEKGVEITRMLVLYEELLHRVPIQHLDTYWLLHSFGDEARVSGFYVIIKRLLDIVGGLVGVTAFLLILPFVGMAIWLESGRPILFSQTRLGRGGKPFEMVKFRTMRQDAEADGQPKWATEDDNRATRVGRFLRKTHLDELPQVINVVRGEMSLVGPRAERPELVKSLQETVPFYRARLLAKPGITGWAQINYGYAASVKATMIKLEHDLYYIKHRSLWLDLLILLRTPWTVLGFRGR
jgi:exopolysaccharide biosynthesis polyprenyl glycosylphosphotransferase